jgi:hypothetical protein
MARGLETLWYTRSLMNPRRYGAFAWMLVSHKLCRWLVHLALPLALIGLALLAPESVVAQVLLIVALLIAVAGTFALAASETRRLPLPLAIAGFLVAVNVAALAAWWKAAKGERNPIWEPTRRPGDAAAAREG